MIPSVTNRGNGKALDTWATHCAAGDMSEGSIYLYRRYLVRFLGHRAVYAVSVEDCEAWLSEHDWAPSTRRSAISALRSFYRWAFARGLMAEDPTAGLHRPKLPEPCPKPCPDAALAQALLAEGDVWWLVRLASTTGLRRAELARVASGDVELHRDGYWLRVTGKGRRVRMVPLERPVAQWVMSAHGWAFPSNRIPGAHVTPDCVARRLKRILSGYSAHTLRHHYATEAYQESGDLLATQLLLGHRSPVTTIGYVQQDPARLRKAAAAAWVA